MANVKHRIVQLLGAAILMSTSVVSAAAQSTDDAAPVQGLDKLLCRDVVLMTGLDRDTTIAFMHGYLTHKRGDSIVDVERIERSTGKFLSDCVDNPTSTALATLEKAFEN